MKTRTVKFTFGTCKDAELEIPTEPTNLVTVARLIRESSFRYMMRGALVSDEVLLSSIGVSNFFAGALGGWQTRLEPKDFEALKGLVEERIFRAVQIAQFRDASLTLEGAYRRAVQNEALAAHERDLLQKIIDAKIYWD